MRVLFEITHPALVHLFRHAIAELTDRDHEVTITSREKGVTAQLLDAYDLPHRSLSTKGETALSLATEWARREVRIVSVARSVDPDVIVSQISPAAAHAAGVTRSACVLFADSEVEWLPIALTRPFADVICTPANFASDLGSSQRRYRGFHELAYLHPDRFEPDPDRLRRHGVNPSAPYSVVRFVSWSAHHDVGSDGFTRAGKRELVTTLADQGDVYVTSEGRLPATLDPYRLPVPPEVVHDLLYYADVYVGDSQTMATEAAVLGTPSVRSNSFAGEGDMSNFVELESEYGLVRSTPEERAAIETAEELAADPGSDERWDRRRERLLADKIDVTDFVVDTILAEGSA